MANYKVIATTENVTWPAYVSTVLMEGEQLLKAANVLEKSLITLEAYGGPSFAISSLKSAQRTSIFLYEIIADLMDAQGEIRECQAMILNEPWMKANSIATATFEFANGDYDYGADESQKLVIKRKKSMKYYKDSEMIYEEPKNLASKLMEQRNLSGTKLITDV